MAEDKAPLQAAPKTEANPDKLVSRIAQAYRTIPPEEREKTQLYASRDEQVENPELDSTFEKLVETYAHKTGEKGKATIHVLPGSGLPPLEEDGPAPAAEGDSSLVVVMPYECAECGHLNPGENRFCGMCGSVHDDTPLELSPTHARIVATPAAAPATIVQHHHHYHHHREINRYLAGLVLVLVGIFAWQQLQSFWPGAPGGTPTASSKAPAPPTGQVVSVPTAGTGTASPAATATPVNPAPAPVATKPVTQTPPNPAPSARPAPPTAVATRTPPPASASPAASAPAAAPVVEAEPTPPPLSAVRNPLEGVAPPPVPLPKPVPAARQRVSQGVSAGNPIHRVAPVYPALARRANIEGTVVLQAVIAADGSVSDVKALSGHPMLTKAALDAVKQWRYKPYTINGEPVEVDTTITIRFNR